MKEPIQENMFSPNQWAKKLLEKALKEGLVDYVDPKELYLVQLIELAPYNGQEISDPDTENFVNVTMCRLSPKQMWNFLRQNEELESENLIYPTKDPLEASRELINLLGNKLHEAQWADKT